MAIKYYSERTKQFFDTVEACEDAELKAKEQENRERILKERKEREEKELQEKKTAARKADALKVEAARKEMVTAQKKYRDELADFCKTYGSYHYTSSSVDDIPTLFSDFWKIFF